MFLYLAMANGMPTGLASLVLQASAPFTVVLAAVFLRERVTARQGLGILLAVAGLGGIAAHRAGLDGGATLVPVLLTLAGGLGWAIGNLGSRKAMQASPHEPIRLLLWMSVVPPLPMLALSLATEGPTQIAESFTGLTSTQGLLAIAGLGYTVLVATLCGGMLWTGLMGRHPSSTVAPFSMLVPVVGIGASWVLLRERTSVTELAWGALVVGGVLLGSTRSRRSGVRDASGAPTRARGRAGARPSNARWEKWWRGRRAASARGDHQRRRDRRDAFPTAGQPEPVGRRRGDAHRSSRRRGQRGLGLGAPLTQARPVPDHLHGDVPDDEPGRPHARGSLGQQDRTGGARPLRLRRAEVRPEVTQTGRGQEGVGTRVRGHIGIRVALQGPLAGPRQPGQVQHRVGRR